jgi:hypothetical protein
LLCLRIISPGNKIVFSQALWRGIACKGWQHSVSLSSELEFDYDKDRVYAVEGKNKGERKANKGHEHR